MNSIVSKEEFFLIRNKLKSINVRNKLKIQITVIVNIFNVPCIINILCALSHLILKTVL